MKKKEKTQTTKMFALIADRISAYRMTYGRNSLQRIYMSKSMFVFLVGKTRAAKLLEEENVTLFGIETVLFDSDKMEYSFAGATYEAEEVKK